jgi:hypothetical protein
MGGYGLVIGPAGYQHEGVWAFGLLEKVIIQAAGLAADGRYQFKQQLLHALAVRRLAPNGHEQVAFGSFIGHSHKQEG